MDEIIRLHLMSGWLGMLAGVASGAVIGLFFHRADWLGGYGAFPRRMVRLGHIAFFGVGFISFLFALSAPLLAPAPAALAFASRALLIGQAGMPALCFLTAWRPAFRHLFFIPVLAIAAACILLVAGGRA